MTMKSVTFTMSKGGVGKSLITANVGAALAEKEQKVILVEGDPNRPLQTILGVEVPSDGFKLDDVMRKDMDVERASYPTQFDNLFLIPSGISLEDYLEIDPENFARKLCGLKADFMLVDVPFPLGSAALLSLGISEYFLIILTEDELVLCIESAIDTLRLGSYLLKCVPLGFILNRIKTPRKFDSGFMEDLEGLLEIPCVAKIREDAKIWKSYGEWKSKKAFLAYKEYRESQFAKSVDEIADLLTGSLPKSEKGNIIEFVQKVIKPIVS